MASPLFVESPNQAWDMPLDPGMLCIINAFNGLSIPKLLPIPLNLVLFW